jgi:hypothetical protein
VHTFGGLFIKDKWKLCVKLHTSLLLFMCLFYGFFLCVCMLHVYFILCCMNLGKCIVFVYLNIVYSSNFISHGISQHWGGWG